jgi:hypothetical protein
MTEPDVVAADVTESAPTAGAALATEPAAAKVPRFKLVTVQWKHMTLRTVTFLVGEDDDLEDEDVFHVGATPGNVEYGPSRTLPPVVGTDEEHLAECDFDVLNADDEHVVEKTTKEQSEMWAAFLEREAACVKERAAKRAAAESAEGADAKRAHVE